MDGLQVSQEDVGEMLTRQSYGPIVYLSDTRSPGHRHSPSLWSEFMDMEHHQKMGYVRRIVRLREDNLEDEQSQWSFRKLLVSFLGRKGDRKKTRGKGPEAYNIYDRKPDFQNNYGWSIALDDKDYSPLRQEDIGVYLVNLTAVKS